MSDDFELGGEDEMSLRQARLFNVLRDVMNAHRRADEHLCL